MDQVGREDDWGPKVVTDRGERPVDPDTPVLRVLLEFLFSV